MLTQLEPICNELNHAFLYGELEAFVRAIDHQTGPVIYHRGYGAGQFSFDLQGAVDTTEQFEIWLIGNGTFADEREASRADRFESMFPVARALLRKLSTDYEIKQCGYRTEPVVAESGVWVSAVKLTGTAKLKYQPESICA